MSALAQRRRPPPGPLGGSASSRALLAGGQPRGSCDASGAAAAAGGRARRRRSAERPSPWPAPPTSDPRPCAAALAPAEARAESVSLRSELASVQSELSSLSNKLDAESSESERRRLRPAAPPAWHAGVLEGGQDGGRRAAPSGALRLACTPAAGRGTASPDPPRSRSRRGGSAGGVEALDTGARALTRHPSVLPCSRSSPAEAELQAAVEALRKQYTEVGDRLEQEQGLVLQLR